MDHLKLSIAMSVGIVLVGCGGGGGSAPAPAKPAQTVYYTPDAPRTGDSYYFNDSKTTSGFVYGVSSSSGAVSTKSLDQVGGIAADGSHYINQYINGFLTQNGLFDRERNLVRMNNCSFTPALDELQAPFFVGQTFSQTSTSTCTTSLAVGNVLPSKITTHSIVQSYEHVTVAAGQFNTLKIKTDIATSSGIGVTTAESKTCWLDVISGVEVKCTGVTNYDYRKTTSPSLLLLAFNLGGGIGSVSDSYELTQIKHGADFPFSLTANIDGAVIPSVYLTPNEQLPLIVEQGKTLTLNASEALSWKVQGVVATDTPITLVSGSQVVNVDGYTLNIAINAGKLEAKVVAAPGPLTGSGGFNIVGSSFVDVTQHVGVTVFLKQDLLFPTTPVLTSCFGALKFC